MQQFKDSKNNNWEVTLDIAAAKRVRDLVGVDILAPEAGDVPLQTRIGTEVMLMVDIIYAIIRPQLDKMQIDDVAFGGLLGGDAIISAQTALYSEMINFFQQCGRQDRVSALGKQQQLIDLSIKEAETQIEAIDATEKVTEIFGKSSIQ